MKALPIIVKVLLNIIFFMVYLIIAVIVENFIFGLIVSEFLNKSVPDASDPIHLKLAGLVLVLVIVITGLMRKYFYISLNLTLKKSKNTQNNQNTKNEVTQEEKKQDEEIQPVKEEKIEEIKVEKKIEIIDVKNADNKDEEELEIFIDKEIK